VRGLFVTGTDTGVGKSVVSAALLASMCAAGVRASAYKPVLTGTGEPSQGDWPADDELLALACGSDASSVAPLRFEPAVSPHLAAELAGRPLDPDELVAGARRLAPGAQDVLVAEGVGGLLVPLAGDYLLRDLAGALGLPLLIAARPGLGTINHTLLTLQAARAADLDVRAVVLTPWPQNPGTMQRSNRATIASLGEVEVCVLEPIAVAEPAALAEAGAALPWRSWLDTA
jgi:dethiobiotin synthetase